MKLQYFEGNLTIIIPNFEKKVKDGENIGS